VVRKETAKVLKPKVVREVSLNIFGIKFMQIRSAVFLLTNGRTDRQNEYFLCIPQGFCQALNLVFEIKEGRAFYGSGLSMLGISIGIHEDGNNQS
jgi:hypothetical protein